MNCFPRPSVQAKSKEERPRSSHLLDRGMPSGAVETCTRVSSAATRRWKQREEVCWKKRSERRSEWSGRRGGLRLCPGADLPSYHSNSRPAYLVLLLVPALSSCPPPRRLPCARPFSLQLLDRESSTEHRCAVRAFVLQCAAGSRIPRCLRPNQGRVVVERVVL